MRFGNGWFAGAVNRRVSLTALAGRAASIERQRDLLETDITAAITARTEVLATTGQEIAQLKQLRAAV